MCPNIKAYMVDVRKLTFEPRYAYAINEVPRSTRINQFSYFTGTDYLVWTICRQNMKAHYPVSILHKSIAGRYRPVRIADGPITARYRFM